MPILPDEREGAKCWHGMFCAFSPMDACDVVGHWGKHADGEKVSGTGTGRTAAYERDLGLTGES